VRSKKFSRKVLIDSGGVQGEIYLLRKPFVVAGKSTERVKPVEYNQALLCDTDELDEDKITRMEARKLCRRTTWR
jgi:UDP-N-acetylglucosamine 2-epimerase